MRVTLWCRRFLGWFYREIRQSLVDMEEVGVTVTLVVALTMCRIQMNIVRVPQGRPLSLWVSRQCPVSFAPLVVAAHAR